MTIFRLVPRPARAPFLLMTAAGVTLPSLMLATLAHGADRSIIDLFPLAYLAALLVTVAFVAAGYGMGVSDAARPARRRPPARRPGRYAPRPSRPLDPSAPYQGRPAGEHAVSGATSRVEVAGLGVYMVPRERSARPVNVRVQAARVASLAEETRQATTAVLDALDRADGIERRLAAAHAAALAELRDGTGRAAA